MKKEQQQLFVALAMGAAIIGVIAYFVWPSPTEAPGTGTPVDTNNNNEDMSGLPAVKAPSAPPKSSPPAQKSPATPTARSGSYQAYSAEKAAALVKTGIVVLFFNSVSCKPCQALDADITAHASVIPKDVAILEVDYDTNAELKQKFGVQVPHLLIQLDAWGGRMQQWGGSATLAELVTRLARY